MAGLGQAGAFHAEVVLVAVEVRHPVVADGLAEHGPGGGRAAVQGVGPVLDADPAAEQRVERVRDVAGGEDVLIGGAQGRVGQHAVADFEPGAGGQVVVRGRADADDQDVGRDLGAAGGDDHAGAELDRPLAEAELHAVRLVQAGEDGAELGTELVVQRAGLRLEHGHRAVGRAGGRGGLQADPAGPGHHHPRAPLERRTQPVGIAHRTQVEHLLAVGAGEGEAARRGAGGEQQPVVGHLPVTARPGGGHGGRAAVDGRDGDTLAQVHVVFGVPLGSVHVDRVTAVLAEQVALGQRRALVRALRSRSPAARSRRRIPRPAGFRRPWPRPGWRRRSQR